MTVAERPLLPLLRFQLPLNALGASGNMRIHWAERMRQNRRLRDNVHVHALQARLKARLPVCSDRRRVQFTVTWPPGKKGKLPDQDNLVTMLKAALDGLTSAGLIHDDNERWLDYAMPIQYRGELPTLVLTVNVWDAVSGG